MQQSAFCQAAVTRHFIQTLISVYHIVQYVNAHFLYILFFCLCFFFSFFLLCDSATIDLAFGAAASPQSTVQLAPFLVCSALLYYIIHIHMYMYISYMHIYLYICICMYFVCPPLAMGVSWRNCSMRAAIAFHFIAVKLPVTYTLYALHVGYACLRLNTN